MSEADDATAYRGPDIPEPLGDQLQTALGLDQRPRTFGDWVDALAHLLDRDGVRLGPDALCTTDESQHTATFDDRTVHYQCPQDAFMVPFLAEDVDVVEIATETPVRGETVTVTVTGDEFEVDPESALVSFGIAADVDGPETDAASPALAYGRFCPYGHAFVDEAEYEEWAAEADAFTMQVGVDDTFELARAVGRVADD
jgi:hypothetical protein